MATVTAQEAAGREERDARRRHASVVALALDLVSRNNRDMFILSLDSRQFIHTHTLVFMERMSWMRVFAA